MKKKISTTRMSSKGQIVIPEEIRNSLGLLAGQHFVVVGEKDMVMLKVITTPTISDFDALAKQARAQARKAGVKKSDVTLAIKKARKKK